MPSRAWSTASPTSGCLCSCCHQLPKLNVKPHKRTGDAPQGAREEEIECSRQRWEQIFLAPVPHQSSSCSLLTLRTTASTRMKLRVATTAFLQGLVREMALLQPPLLGHRVQHKRAQLSPAAGGCVSWHGAGGSWHIPGAAACARAARHEVPGCLCYGSIPWVRVGTGLQSLAMHNIFFT